MLGRAFRRVGEVARWNACALPVLLLLGVYVGFLYRRAVGIGVLSDGWHLLEIGSHGLLEASKVTLSYHTIPVANLLFAVLWKTFGLWERGYQLANLAEMTLLGWLIYLLGCTLFRQPRIALLASLLFLANSSFYEVPFWPVVGNFQSLAAFFYVGGIFAVHQAFRWRRPWGWLALFALCVLAAFFTYEPAISLLFVGFAYAAVWPASDGLEAWRPRLRRLGILALAVLPVLTLIIASKVYAASTGHTAMFLPTSLWDLRFRLHLLVRACIGIFTLRGSDPAIYYLFTFRRIPSFATPLYHIFLGGWLLVLTALSILLVLKARPAVRFLTLWTAIHLAVVSAATGIVSRHFYLAAIPAALLLAWALWSGADRAAAALERVGVPSKLGMTAAQTATVLVFIAALLLLSGAKNDLNAAAEIYNVASKATRQVLERVQARLPELPARPRIVLVNMPAGLLGDGVSAFSFVNGLHHMLFLSTQGRIQISDVQLFHTYDQPQPGKYANGSQPIGLDQFSAVVRDPGSLVLMFDRTSRTVREVTRAGWRVPNRYMPETAPYLEWQPGAWPWLRVYAGLPLKLPLAPDGEGSWAAVKYLRNPVTTFSVQAGSTRLMEVRPQPVSTPFWPTAVFPLPKGSTGVTLEPISEVWIAGLTSFAPPAEYTPESAPFLDWMERPEPAFIVHAPMRLPLSTWSCQRRPCKVELKFLAQPGRDFSITVEAGRPRTFDFSGIPPAWQSAMLELEEGTVPEGASEVIIQITPTGGTPALVRSLAWRPSQPSIR
ncbi:MAG TPA: hypothetical protein VGG03_00510 [Thermoanaerobaculia bacterium]